MHNETSEGERNQDFWELLGVNASDWTEGSEANIEIPPPDVYMYSFRSVTLLFLVSLLSTKCRFTPDQSEVKVDDTTEQILSEENSVVLDTHGSICYVWNGKEASKNLQQKAHQFAERRMAEPTRPSWKHIKLASSDKEPYLFKFIMEQINKSLTKD